MTPAGQPLLRESMDRLPVAVLGILLLALIFTPGRDPVTHGLSVVWHPSAELAFLLLLVTIGAAVRPQIIVAPLTARILAVLVVAMALLNLVNAATPTLL